MKDIHGPARAQAAVATLANNRLEAKALFGVQSVATSYSRVDAFPRSRTFRWLLRHPIGRWVGSAVITGVLAHLPFGRFVSLRLLSDKM